MMIKARYGYLMVTPSVQCVAHFGPDWLSALSASKCRYDWRNVDR